ncbi:MAG: response regulator transcription factor [Lachnospiraceae bacterium]|nr:response regulator transcription factor [Lachnospiraceae bacterium]
MKIYIVEDEITIRSELAKLLESYGYTCAYSDDFQNIVEHILKEATDLILLDINLPFYDGYHVCREIRKQTDTPIIIVTSRNNDMDELMSMNLGADDFVTKPYNTQILLARIAAVLKRSDGKNAADSISHNGLTLFLNKSVVRFQNTDAELTKNEFRILAHLIQNAGKIVSREDLIEELWQSDEFIDDNTLTVNINRLRHKLEEIGAEQYINTKRGQGYII